MEQLTGLQDKTRLTGKKKGKQKTILRAQWDKHKEKWKIVSKTENVTGDWENFKEETWYCCKYYTERIIDEIVRYDPELCMMDTELIALISIWGTMLLLVLVGIYYDMRKKKQ